MYCSSCGHKNEKSANYCSSCGSYIADSMEVKTASIPVINNGNDLDLEDLNLDNIETNFAFLVLGWGPNAGEKYLLDKKILKVGRHPESDIFLDDVTVSRRHAEFSKREDTYWVKDVGSLNGTYLNRERVEEAELRTSDIIQIGKFKLHFLEASK